MTETQLFYLTIMIGLFVLYLIVSKICEAFEVKHKAIAMASMKITDISEDEELRQKLLDNLNNGEENIDEK